MSAAPTRRHIIVSLAAASAAAFLRPRILGQSVNGSSRAPAVGTFDPISVPNYELLARERMSPEAWEFIATGCGDDVTLQWNREALTRLRLEPRVMIDVSNITPSISLFGRERPYPILLAPTAAHMLEHPAGEVATAEGASKARAIIVASTVSNRSIAEITAATREPVWFQLYVQHDRGLTKDIIQRAEAAGCDTLCITVDLPVKYMRDRVEHVLPRMPHLPFPNVDLISANAAEPRHGKRDNRFSWSESPGCPAHGNWHRAVPK